MLRLIFSIETPRTRSSSGPTPSHIMTCSERGWYYFCRFTDIADCLSVRIIEECTDLPPMLFLKGDQDMFNAIMVDLTKFGPPSVLVQNLGTYNIRPGNPCSDDPSLFLERTRYKIITNFFFIIYDLSEIVCRPNMVADGKGGTKSGRHD